MAKGAKQKMLRVGKRYPEGSKHLRQYEALREYYGPAFSEVFFQAAWSALGPLADALQGESYAAIQRIQAPSKHFIEALHTEALTLASGDEQGNFAAGPPMVQPEPIHDLEDLGDYEVNDDNDVPMIAIAGDPFG